MEKKKSSIRVQASLASPVLADLAELAGEETLIAPGCYYAASIVEQVKYLVREREFRFR